MVAETWSVTLPSDTDRSEGTFILRGAVVGLVYKRDCEKYLFSFVLDDAITAVNGCRKFVSSRDAIGA
jgi:hypothetical protein